MMQTKIERFKLSIGTEQKVAALVIDQDNELLEDNNFLNYVNNLFIGFGCKARKISLNVIVNEKDYIMNKAFMHKFYEFPVENHIVVFENGLVTEYQSLKEVKKLYDKAKKSLSK